MRVSYILSVDWSNFTPRCHINYFQINKKFSTCVLWHRYISSRYEVDVVKRQEALETSRAEGKDMCAYLIMPLRPHSTMPLCQPQSYHKVMRDVYKTTQSTHKMKLTHGSHTA